MHDPLTLSLGLLSSSLIGLLLGIIGGGGAIVLVPVLVNVLGVAPHEAMAMSLAVVGATGAIGMILHARHDAVDFNVGSLFGGAGIFGALLGSRLTYLLTPPTLMLSFAALMLVTATAMLARREPAGAMAERSPRIPTLLGLGFVVGVITGFFGVGGGFLIVPALVLFGGLQMKKAVGTSLLVIVINCAAGLIGHLRHGGFDAILAAYVCVSAVLGTLTGSWLSRRVSALRLERVFALLVIAVAAYLVAQNAHVLFP